MTYLYQGTYYNSLPDLIDRLELDDYQIQEDEAVE